MNRDRIPSPNSNTPHLRFENVALKAPLGPRYLLQSITFSLMEGDRLAIVGPSGAGKTSLLRLMNRLIDPSDGTITYGNRPLTAHSVIDLRQSMPLVLQESRLLGMNVRQSLAYPLTLRKLNAQDIKQRLEKWMERLHLPKEWLDRTEVQLSVGQRQLVAIARALMVQPQMLLLDEPTAALDVGRRSHLVETLVAYSQATPCTMVMVTHDLDIAQEFCTKLLYLANGKIVQHSLRSDIDWQAIKHSLIPAEKEEQAEWDDDISDDLP